MTAPCTATTVVTESNHADAPRPVGPCQREAARINSEHNAVVGAERQALLHAIRAGQLLLDVKRRVPHGDFLPWIGANCRFTARTAQLYMALARELSSKCETVSHLGLRDALALVRVPRAQPPWLGLKRLTVTLEFESTEAHARYWALLGTLHARGNPVPTVLRALDTLIESQSFVEAAP